MAEDDAPLWAPTAERIRRSVLREYLDGLEARTGRPFPDHDALRAWSVEHLEDFWVSVVDHFDVAPSTPWTQVLTPDPMPHARWFTGARLNWAEHLLRRGADDAPALVRTGEDGGPPRETTFAELRRAVASVAGWLRAAGVRPGDRVVAYLPNTEHAVIGCLATAWVGAVWACCSPDFGAEGTVGRLGQLEPTVLLAADGYHWNGRVVDRRDVVARLREALPSLRHVVHVPYVTQDPPPEGTAGWDDVLATRPDPAPEQVEFSHPLWVLFTSGTTGRPKGLVHSQGGLTLEGARWTGLYCGLRPGERMLAVTTTGWALWNMQVGALGQGAAVVLYEGSPGHPPGGVWEVAARTRADVMLLGAAVVTASTSAPRPPGAFDLGRLRHVMVSGSALPPQGYGWILEHVGGHVRVDSTSGGTDVSGSFVGSDEYAPVRAGRIGGRLAGVDCAAWDEDGRPVVGVPGELVVTRPMPSMPVALWDDPDGSRYTASYLGTWPGVWHHGDRVTVHADGSVTVHGRSDATLNRQGVRLGTGDFYDVLEDLPEVADSLVVGVEQDDGGYWLGLFVVPAPGHVLDDELRGHLRTTLRTRLTPRHVPDDIVGAPGVPRTLTGKKLEVPVKRLLLGTPLTEAVSTASVDDPDVLRWYERFAADRSGGR